MTTVKVRSEKDPDVEYEVNLENGECSCPAYQKRLKDLNAQDGGERRCKHYVRAQEQSA